MATFKLSAFADEAAENLEEQIIICKDNGIEAIEMRGVNGKSIADHTPAEAKEIKKIMDASGMTVSALGSPYGKTPVDENFETAFERYKRGVELAQILGTSYIRMFSFYIPKGKNHEDYKNEVIDRIGRFLDASDGLILAHENEHGIYGDSPERCLTLYEAFGGRLKLVFDPANYILDDYDTMKAFELLSGKIEYMHIKDAGKDKKILPAGHGVGCISEILKKYAETDGCRWLTIEPHLRVFPGFKTLGEADELENPFIYESNREAFEAAVMSFKSVLCAGGFVLSKDINGGTGEWSL